MSDGSSRWSAGGPRRTGLAELVRRVREGAVHSEALVEHALAAQARLDGRLGAFCAVRAEEARAEARVADDVRLRFGVRGPLHGIPVSVKDHFGVRGLPTYAGTARELPRRFRREGPVVSRLRRQLGIVLGKTVAVELAFGGIGTNPHFGSPVNPWDLAVPRVCGGSSSGAGVSLLEGAAWLALGTDTAGSSRIPAAMTGVVGLKTTIGRWSTEGVVPLSTTLDTVGLLGRTVQDVAVGFLALDPKSSADFDAELANMQEAPGAAAGLRFGVVREQLWDEASPGVAEAVERALSVLSAAGVRLEERPLPEARESEDFLRQGSVASAELDAFLEAELPAWREILHPTVASRIADGANLTAREYLLRLRRLEALSAGAARSFAGLDALLCPTVVNTPPPLAALEDLAAYRHENFLALRNTCVANFCGLCALSVPAGLDAAGLPVGLQILAPGGRDRDLLRLGIAVERMLAAAGLALGDPPGCKLE